MRSALIGATADSLDETRKLVSELTPMIHSDVRAEEGANVLTLAAFLGAQKRLSWEAVVQ